MKVLLRNIHCPFICFCKSSSSHIYKAAPLKLENGGLIPQQLSVSEDAVDGAAISNDHKNAQNVDDKENKNENENDEDLKDNISNSNTRNQRPNGGCLKSSLRKSSESDLSHSASDPDPVPAPAHNKKVQWLDLLGKELAEIREFESSEEGDADYEGVSSRGCVCNIL